MGKISPRKTFGRKKEKLMETEVMLNRAQIELELTVDIANKLSKDIREFGSASLVVSGGSTPKNLFNKLSNEQLDWSKVSVLLVDERFLPNGHKDQNGEMVKNELLINHAAKSNFIPMVFDPSDESNNLNMAIDALASVKQPFSAVILGMGTDGHTASLFPDSPQLNEAMSEDNNRLLMNISTPSSPYKRITFTRNALLNTSNLYLHCYGYDKKKILDQIRSAVNHTNYPIAQFIHQTEADTKIYWAE